MYKICIGICFINVLILKIHAANPSNCLIDSVDINWDAAYYQNKQIDDIDLDTVVATWTFTSNLTNVTYDDSKYLDIRINDKQLIFKTNDEFKNFDKDHTDTKNVISFSFNIYLKCENDQQSSLTFEQPVRDTNNNNPTFLKDSYSYQIPMPILPNYMITNFGDPIIAEDLDFSNTDITFTITPNDNFAIQTQSLGNKQYEARITVTQPIKYNQTTQFTLTATDSGVPANTAVTTITIEVDEDNSIPDPPKFTRTNYNFDYTISDDGQAVLIATNGDIVITTESSDDLTFDLTPELDGLEYSFNKTTKIVTITLNSPLSDLTQHTIVLTLTVSNSVDTTSATILINIPDDLVEVKPKFSSAFYSARYTVNDDGTDTVKVDGTISITPSSGVNVEIIGDYKDNFAISNGNNQWTLTVIKDLDNTILEKGGNIVVEIQATITGNDATEVGLIVVELPQTETVIPKFSSPYYSATYTVNDDGTDTVKVDSTISVTPSSGVNVEVIGDYANYFDISCTDQCVLKLKQNLPETVLDEDTETILTISATISSQSTEATIIIDLPLKQTVNPIKFSESIYIGDYVKSSSDDDDSNDSVQLENGPISVIDGTTTDTIVTTDDSYFKIEIDDNHWVIIVNVNLPETILQQSTYILELKLTKNTIINSCKVVIKLPKQVVTSPIEFTKILYTGDYQPDTKKLQIETIQLIGQQLDQVTIALTGEFSKYFTNNYNKNNGIITLSISEITEDIINANSAISINIEATLDTVVVSSGVIITFPKVSTNQITFNDVLYISKYDDTANSLETDQTIIVKTTHLDMVEISLKGDSAQYFKYSYDKETGEISIDNVAIPSSVVDENSAISFEIFAELIKNNQQQANSSVGFVVKLSKNIVKSDSVDFNKALYVGEYKTDNSDNPAIVLNETIKMSLIDSTGSISDVQVTATGDESDYFTVKNDNGQIEISCKKLPDQVLAERTVITLTLKAVLTTDTKIVGEAGFVVQLPASNNSGGGGGGDNGDDCDCDDTAYIVVIVILAILLIAGLLGSGTFYYLRRRRGSSYKNMDKISGAANKENRYVKNANFSENKKFDPPPVRRPTGLTQFPAYDEKDNDIVDNDNDEPGRRKSVIFDDTIEELQIEAKNNEINDEPTTEI